MESNRISNQGTAIEFIDSQTDNLCNQLPLVIVPGLSESAEDYIPLMNSISFRCITISLRGRGGSAAPVTGYTLEDHISDIDSVIRHLELDSFVLMGFSRGVSYAIGYYFRNTGSIKGLIIGDYPAQHTKLPLEWIEYFTALPPWREKLLSERMKAHAIHGIQKESSQVSFRDQLAHIDCPVLVIQGGKEGSALSRESKTEYQEQIRQLELIVFEASAHNIFEPDLNVFKKTAETFMSKIVETIQPSS
ncbi:alpha/beta hydrolase [Sporosarcina sp.]|uniref:alpha/beta fold hydrolase n=1 Tax=Sporosarcina sp. TaxID=49982 RepID=UPI002608D0AA|nr:alpha/beta hydrolase [Sporosarcina sp.]